MKNLNTTEKIKTLAMVSILLLLLLGHHSKAYESPDYTVIHSDSDFEIRLYEPSVWMTAPVKQTNFRQATNNGFHRLFQYIEGANLNNSRVSMTVPVLTSLVPGLDSSAYIVQFYLPANFQATPPLPLPELNLKPDSWPTTCKAVRQFSGFAREKNTVKEVEKLTTSLSGSQYSTSSSSEFAYSIAQYNSPLKFFGRVNEVWMDVEGCESNNVAAY
uniref:heme-binding protein 2-like n=1 Tax=Erigeron canadensis TaxID=72917 RepID=UPI001CB9580B|nr:heme-binding protein 2-like [Erigeron canadensis]